MAMLNNQVKRKQSYKLNRSFSAQRWSLAASRRGPASVLCIGVLTLALAMSLHAAPTIDVSVTFGNDAVRHYRVKGPRTLKLKTCAGPLKFDIRRVQSIVFHADTETMMVAFSNGERWNANRPENVLAAIGCKAGTLAQDHGVRKISITSPASKPYELRHHIKLLLCDNSRTFVNPAALSIPIATQHGTMQLPIGSLRALKFLDAPEGTPPSIALVRFPTGRIQRLTMQADSHCFHATDCYGNKLKIDYQEILGLLNTCRMKHLPDQPMAAQPPEKNALIKTRDDGTLHVALPLDVWTLKTNLGLLSFPSAVVTTIRQLSPPANTTEIHTVFGEIFRGALTSKAIIIKKADATDVTRLAFNAVKSVKIPYPKLQIPDDWFVLHTQSGMHIVARFADMQTGLITQKGNTVAANEIFSLTAAPKKAFVVASKYGNIQTCHNRTSKARYILLINGAHIEVPWRDIHFAKFQKTIEAHPQRASTTPKSPPATPPEKPEKTRPRKTVKTPVIQQAQPSRADEIRIPGGRFVPGNLQNAKPQNKTNLVAVSPFFMDATEVTRRHFAAFVKNTGYVTQAERSNAPHTWRSPGFEQNDNEPVVCVTWYDAVAFCNWRSQQAGFEPCYRTGFFSGKIKTNRNHPGYRLPTDIEWEYAARNEGHAIRFPWGPSAAKHLSKPAMPSVTALRARRYAHFHDATELRPQSKAGTISVKALPPTALGIYGLPGNVWEWCQDWYASDNPEDRHKPKTRKVMRGGSFRSPLQHLRCTHRGWGVPYATANRIGFRCVRNAP